MKIVQFIERAMRHDPKKRPRADELLMDPWFETPPGEYMEDVDARRKANRNRSTFISTDLDGTRVIAIEEKLEATKKEDQKVGYLVQ